MWNITSGLMINTMLLMVQKQNETDTSTPLNVGAKEVAVPEERCYGNFGCFDISSPWISESRPIALFPFTPEDMNVRYPAFSRRNTRLPHFLDPLNPNTIKNYHINPRGPFYFICHGYLESGDKIWVQKLTEALLKLEENSEATVISVDWRAGSAPPYSQAVANIRLVGSITAYLINEIFRTLKLRNLDNFHIIGHSLGAHCGGYTGSTLIREYGLTLGRITGMDPAEPHFGKTESIVRLDQTDAKFVDVIHTDASPFISGGLGISESIGHVDFFPNSGSNQPGCNQAVMSLFNSKDGSVFRGIKKFFSCNHLRSYEYFTESILTSCKFMTIECPNYQDYLKGACFQCGQPGHHCISFGYYSYLSYKSLVHAGGIISSQPIKLFFMTSDTSPFCRMQYRVTVNISSSMESSTNGGDVGRLWMVLINKNGTKSDKIPLDEYAGYHKPGTQRTLVVPGDDIGIPVSAIIECEYETNILNPLTWRIMMSSRVYVAWVHIDSLEYKTSITVCPPHESPVIANTPSHFQQQNCHNISPIKISLSSRYNFFK